MVSISGRAVIWSELARERCNAANVVLMNDVEMVIEIAKKLVWKDDLKPVAVFGSKEAIFDSIYESEIKKQHLL